VHHGPVVKGMRRIIIETDEGTRHEYSVPRSVHVNVQEGERVRAGARMFDGRAGGRAAVAAWWGGRRDGWVCGAVNCRKCGRDADTGTLFDGSSRRCLAR
jgi:hypothetical protein